MLIFKRYRVLATLAGLLAASCAGAVPTIDAQANWQARSRKPPTPGVANCGGQPVNAERGERRGAEAAWNGSDEASLSNSARRAVQGGGKADLDGYTGRCRLADADHDDQVALNDGLDPDKLLKTINELADVNRALSPEEEQALLDKLGKNVHVEIDSVDHEMHAYVGAGANRQDLGQLARLDLQQLEEDGVVVLHYGQDVDRYGQGKHDGADLRSGAAAAIPEPSTYLMLLSGLVMLALLRRRKHGA